MTTADLDPGYIGVGIGQRRRPICGYLPARALVAPGFLVSVMTQTRLREVGNLPVDLTSFVGRRHATAEVKRTLSESRLVTLLGVGGVGRSTLALHVAYEPRRAFPDGIWLVELAAVHDPALVPRSPRGKRGRGRGRGTCPVSRLAATSDLSLSR